MIGRRSGRAFDIAQVDTGRDGYGVCMRILLAIAVAVITLAVQASERELIFGSELMTDAELDRYRAEVSKLAAERERTQYRERHRQRLRERARARGVELEEPAGVVRRKDAR